MKRILVILIVLVILSTVAQSQGIHFKPNEKPIVVPELSDEEQIRQMLSDLVHGIRNNQVIRAIRPFAENINLKAKAKAKSNRLMSLLFQLDSLSIEVTNDRAFVRCQLNDGWKLKANKELLTLKRTNGYWRIEGSALLIDLITDHFFIYGMNRGGSTTDTEQKQAADGKQQAEGDMPIIESPSPTLSVSAAMMTNTVSSFLMSNKAVVRKLIPYTDQWSITRTTTQSELGVSLFVNPVDGEVVRPNGSSDYIAVMIDKDWNRMVYGSFNGAWIKSYGDDAGDYQLLSPIAIDIDALGNIYCITEYSKSVVKLKYNASSQTINYVSEIPIYGLINPVDVDIDNNGTPTDPNDDTFWVADKDANAILRVSPSGQVLGKATSAVDPYTYETIQFSGPTKVLVFFDFGYRHLSLIDLNKRRVITIYAPTFQGQTISGQITSTEFAPSKNVQLESLGIDYGNAHALWAVDRNNGLVHFFDYTDYVTGGYLASIDQNQWNIPVAIASTIASGSTTNTLDLLTLDAWNNSSGINAYLPGADLVNPYIQYYDWTVYGPTLWGTTLKTTFPTASIVKVNLYRSDGSFIKTLLDGSYTTRASVSNTSVKAGDVGSAYGKYRARYEVTPAYNSYYGQYQQPPLIKDIWFSMPLKASLSGPSTVYHPQKPNINHYTWTCNVTSGAPTFTYSWKKNGYTVGSNSPTYTEHYSYNGGGDGSQQFTLQVTVSDQSSPVQTKTVSMTVTEYDSEGGGGPIDPRIAEQEEAAIPEAFGLSQNYPNPFNPETEIHFALPEPATVRLSVLDILGREIIVLENGRLSAGYKSVHWNGKSANGEAVSSGMYFYHLVATGESGKNFVETKKMLMTK